MLKLLSVELYSDTKKLNINVESRKDSSLTLSNPYDLVLFGLLAISKFRIIEKNKNHSDRISDSLTEFYNRVFKNRFGPTTKDLILFSLKRLMKVWFWGVVYSVNKMYANLNITNIRAIGSNIMKVDGKIH